jgi:hypothetical protein
MKLSALLLASLFALASLSALAEGDMNRKQNPVIDEDGDIVGIIDPNVTCTALADQSGQIVYFCTSDEDEDN